jgi:hypothetical protein
MYACVRGGLRVGFLVIGTWRYSVVVAQQIRTRPMDEAEVDAAVLKARVASTVPQPAVPVIPSDSPFATCASSSVASVTASSTPPAAFNFAFSFASQPPAVMAATKWDLAAPVVAHEVGTTSDTKVVSDSSRRAMRGKRGKRAGNDGGDVWEEGDDWEEGWEEGEEATEHGQQVSAPLLDASKFDASKFEFSFAPAPTEPP